jgi:hypothetical protein
MLVSWAGGEPNVRMFHFSRAVVFCFDCRICSTSFSSASGTLVFEDLAVFQQEIMILMTY